MRGMLAQAGQRALGQQPQRRARAGTVGIGQQVFARRGDAGAVQALHAALAHAVKGAHAVDFIIKKLNAQRVGLTGRIHIHNGAAQGALAFALHHVHALVARLSQARHQIGRLHLIARMHGYGHGPRHLRRGHAPQQRVRRQAEHAHFAALQAAQGGQTLPLALAAGYGAGKLPFAGNHRARPLGQVLADILRRAGGVAVARRDIEHLTAGFERNGGGQRGARALADFIGGRAGLLQELIAELLEKRALQQRRQDKIGHDGLLF